MVLIPRWHEEVADDCIKQFVEVMLNITDGLDQVTDLRQYSQAITSSISKTGKSSEEKTMLDLDSLKLSEGRISKCLEEVLECPS